MENSDGTIIQFLKGTHSYQGVWFGELHPNEKGTFWWRKHLDDYLKTLWNDACDAQLQSISKGFADNLHKTDRESDKDVFIAISETITNYPKPKYNG